MLSARRISHKGLRLLYAKGNRSKLNADWVDKIKRILAAMNVAVSPLEMDLPGYDFHELKGDRQGTYSMSVTGNYRITFRWDTEGPYDVDLEDYHGR